MTTSTEMNNFSINSLRFSSSAPFPLRKGDEMDRDYYEFLAEFEGELAEYIIAGEKKPNTAFNRGFIREMLAKIVKDLKKEAEEYEEHGLTPEEYLAGFSFHYDLALY
jgi:hypothetical protein